MQCALMLNDTALVKEMIKENPSHVHERGSYGYSNIHFAALFQRREAMLAMYDAGAKVDQKCIDLLAAQGYDHRPFRIELHCKNNPDRFKGHYGKTFSQQSIHSSSALFSLWKNGVKETNIHDLKPHEQLVFSEFLKMQIRRTNPPVYVNYHNDKLGLFAEKPLAANSFLLSHIGKVVSKEVQLPTNAKPYITPFSVQVDTQSRGELGAFINCGAEPNLATLPVIYREQLFVLIYTTRAIKENEELVLGQ